MRKRTYGGSSSGYSRRPFKRARTDGTLSAKFKSLQRKVALLSPETKYFRGTVNQTNVTTAGSVSWMSAVLAGTGQSNRIGEKIRVTGIKLRCQYGQFKTVSGTPAMYYFALVKDSESSGAIPTLSGATTSIFSGTGPLQAVAVQDTTKDRFQVVRGILVDSNQLYAGNSPGSTWDWKVKCNSVMTFQSSTDTVADASKNHLYFIIMTDDTTGTLDVACDFEIAYIDV